MKYKNFKMLVFFGIITLFLCITAANSTTMVELSLKDMCQKSSHIVVARTISVNSYLKPGQQRIYTDIVLEVTEKIKGQLQNQESLKLTVYGGTIDGITTLVVGAPTFTVGKQSVLFLLEKKSARSGQNHFTVVGLSQGKFNIFTDNKTNTKKVVRDQLESPLRLEKDGNRLSLTNSQSITLTDFLNRIKNYTK